MDMANHRLPIPSRTGRQTGARRDLYVKRQIHHNREPRRATVQPASPKNAARTAHKILSQSSHQHRAAAEMIARLIAEALGEFRP
jgi:hypothetical protein